MVEFLRCIPPPRRGGQYGRSPAVWRGGRLLFLFGVFILPLYAPLVQYILSGCPPFAAGTPPRAGASLVRPAEGLENLRRRRFPCFQLNEGTAQRHTPAQHIVVYRVCYETGKLQGALYGNSTIGKMLGITFGMALLGFMCRFLPEHGKALNTCNFTLPNIALPLLAVMDIATLTAFYRGRAPSSLSGATILRHKTALEMRT